MSSTSIEALASAWKRIADEAGFPAGYDGIATPEAHRAGEVMQAMQERIDQEKDKPG